MILEQELLGLRIRNMRKKMNITQGELAEILNLDETTISRIEKGKRFPTFKVFLKLIKELKTSPNELLNFISFNESEENTKDRLLLEMVTELDDEIKDKIIELIKAIK